MRLCGLLLIMLVATGCANPESQISFAPQNCWERLGNETYFIGHSHCMVNLPQEEISGYWVSGHEHSMFYADRQSIRHDLDTEAPWLSFSEEPWASVKDKMTGEWQVFAVRFIGTRATMRGCYGHSCTAKSGVLMIRLLEINEIDVRPPETQGIKLQ